MRDLLQREVEVLRGKNEYVPGGNPCGPSERASEPRGRVSFDEQLGGARVPSGNPAGLSEHNRGGPHIYIYICHSRPLVPLVHLMHSRPLVPLALVRGTHLV